MKKSNAVDAKQTITIRTKIRAGAIAFDRPGGGCIVFNKIGGGGGCLAIGPGGGCRPAISRG